MSMKSFVLVAVLLSGSAIAGDLFYTNGAPVVGTFVCCSPATVTVAKPDGTKTVIPVSQLRFDSRLTLPDAVAQPYKNMQKLSDAAEKGLSQIEAEVKTSAERRTKQNKEFIAQVLALGEGVSNLTVRAETAEARVAELETEKTNVLARARDYVAKSQADIAAAYRRGRADEAAARTQSSTSAPTETRGEKLRRLMRQGPPPEVVAEIVRKAKAEWPGDYTMQQYVIGEERTAWINVQADAP